MLLIYGNFILVMIRPHLLEYSMETKKKSKAYKNFTRGISTKATMCDYTDYVKRFMKFHNKEEQYDDVVKLSSKEIDDLISDYLDSLIDRGLKGITQRAHLMGIERLFIMNDCIWHKDRIRKSISKDDDISGGNIPVTTIEISNMLECTKSLRTKALLHFLASTGARPGGISDPILCVKHLVEMYHKNKKCYGVKIYDGSKSGYWAFLTPEATLVLDRWFDYRKFKDEELTDESAIFGNVYNSSKHHYLTSDNARFIVNELIKKSGLKRKKVSKTRYDKAIMYMFRKRFNTILKLDNEINSNITEKLMAHKKGLDGTYLQPTIEECFTEFVKAIPELTINDSARKQFELDKITKEKTDLENVNLVLKQTVKEKEDLARKYREAVTQPITDDEINKRIEDILKKYKDL